MFSWLVASVASAGYVVSKTRPAESVALELVATPSGRFVDRVDSSGVLTGTVFVPKLQIQVTLAPKPSRDPDEFCAQFRLFVPQPLPPLPTVSFFPHFPLFPPSAAASFSNCLIPPSCPLVP